MKNILKFVKTQNRIYAAEIVENILIMIFSFAFKTRKENTFGKYIFNNLMKFNQKDNYDIAEWFDFGEFNLDEFKIDSFEKMKELLKLDENNEIKKDDEKNLYQKQHPIYDFLLEIKTEKNSIEKYRTYKKFMSYIKEEEKYVKENKTKAAKYESDSMFTYYTSINNKGYYPGEIGRGNRSPINLLKSFLISIFIYYQNKHSPLMKNLFINKDKIIPFIYDFNGGNIQSEYASIIMIPSRIEPRIKKLNMGYNPLKEKGIFELAKTLLFNKNIKIIDFKKTALKSNQLLSFNEGLGLFDNTIVEELDISLNYLNNNSESYLAKILSHLKGLKTINLTSNPLKEGISSFLIVLKKLYREKKLNLENLILNNCSLDNISFYELNELLSSKYCKLKNLYLNYNKIPSNSNFFKKLKKNNSLTEIYINESNITNVDLDDIMKIISNTKIENLNIYKNKCNNFDDFLKIIYRTKIVLCEGEIKENHEDAILYNLDLSFNDFYPKNIEQINLLKTSLNDTTLYNLDLSRILYGSEPNIIINKKKESYNDYENAVLSLKSKLDEEERKYKKNLNDINIYSIFINGNKNRLGIKKFETLENDISNIIGKDESIFPLFLKNEVESLIKDKKEFFNDSDKKELVNNLVKYIALKRTEKNKQLLEEEIQERKLILI